MWAVDGVRWLWLTDALGVFGYGDVSHDDVARSGGGTRVRLSTVGCTEGANDRLESDDACLVEC